MDRLTGVFVDPNQVVASYEQEIAAVAARAEEARDRIKNLTGTATSPDGAVTVTVGGAGALQSVSFGPRADELPKNRLAEAIMTAARRAQAQASQRILEIMEPLVGGDSDAMRFVREQIPSPEEPEDEVEESYPGQQALEEEPAEAPEAEPAPPPRPTRPRRPAVDDDEDFESDSPLSREETW
ncbi:MAG: YbaB/EbfC family nucleoid-associated protein [Labedaea sp.]